MLKTVGFPSTRTGDQTIVGGNLVIGTAGNGINFSADPNAPGMTSELLDDYEEGTFTPTLAFGGASTGITYAVNSGSYTKIGRLVTGRFVMVLSDKGSATGGATIEGLPFTVNGDWIGSAVTEICGNFASNAPAQGFCNNAGTNITPWVIGATGPTFTAHTDFNNNTRLDMWFQYFV